MSVKQLTSIEELNEFVQQPGKHLLLKHSTTCPISAKANEEFQAYMNDEEATSAAMVLVIEDRPVSTHIAEEFDIKHESPQLLVFEDGKVTFNTSHWKITKQAIKEALNG